ncbi:hypothetical protein [Pseudomonas oryzihabitans]|uniref:NADH:ubiquinone oxidoreductase n=1 Tax=Pseudomonas oryzihabitans TaxID=47885 RepID=A0AAJ2EWX3_9PSED|nr:hypothetical protein [Pseudomonas psychrotolerans]MDR6235197.1 hypothetical protein [Pseudomonas psychrotolerans]MDR6355580.1 hypothetical protein [Pseudomonas psychrotolerans]
MKIQVILAIASATLAVASQAADYDIKAYCRSVSDAVGGSAQIELTCRKQEERAKASIAGKQAPAKTLAYCQSVGDAIGGSYQILATCINQELAAKAQLDR